MDRDEIVVPRANAEAVFSGFKVKWLSAFEMDKMVKRGRLSIHLQKAPQLSKEWGGGQQGCSSVAPRSVKERRLYKIAFKSITEKNGFIFCIMCMMEGFNIFLTGQH